MTGVYNWLGKCPDPKGLASIHKRDLRREDRLLLHISVYLLSSGPVPQQHDMKLHAHLNSQGPFPVEVSPEKVVRRAAERKQKEIIFFREFYFWLYLFLARGDTGAASAKTKGKELIENEKNNNNERDSDEAKGTSRPWGVIDQVWEKRMIFWILAIMK